MTTSAIAPARKFLTGGEVTPPGDSDGCKNKGFAGKGIRKSMKTKGRQNWLVLGNTHGVGLGGDGVN